MERTRFCGRCGVPLPVGAERCPACGETTSPLGPGGAVAAPSRTADPTVRTRIALLVLAVAVVAELLPFGAVLGLGLLLVGGSLLVLSSDPFGRAHRRSATFGVVLAAAGLAGGFLTAAFFPLVVPPPPQTSGQVPAWIQAFESSLAQAMLTAALFAATSAVGLVLLTYVLQDRTGKACLWIALGLVVAINLLAYLVFNQEMGTLLAEAATGRGLDSALLDAIASQLNQLNYLAIIPQAVFAGCFFLADTRVRRGIVPAARSGAPV